MPMRKIISALFALFLCLFMFSAWALADEPDSAWIEEQLRRLEQQYESGVMPMAFVEGFIPWQERYFTATGLPNKVGASGKSEKMTVAQWLLDCKGVSESGYRVDNTGVKYTKFPQYEGSHFVNVTVNGVEVVRAGILQPDSGSGEPVYYYMTQKHVDSDANDGSGSHTGSVSALLLPEDAQFSVNYAYNDYKFSYEVKLDDVTVTDDPSPVKDRDGNALTWEQAIFEGQNPASSTNGAASFYVVIPYGYTAKVFMEPEGASRKELTGDREDIKDLELRAAKLVNEGHPLGTEPIYDRKGDQIQPTGDGPSAKRMSAVFYDDHVTENRHIVVELKTDTQKPVFDAHFWLATAGAGGENPGSHRGTISKGTSVDTLGQYGSNGDIYPLEGDKVWNWGTIFTQDPRDLKGSKKDVYDGHWKEQSDGIYSLFWAFQTNAPGINYVLDALEINGVFIDIPFRPKYIWNNGDVEHTAQGGTSVTTATLPDGAQVTLTYYREFNGKKQRVYILEITGARSNVTITDGNLMMYDSGAEEYVAVVMSGVTADEDGTDSFGFYGTDGNWGALKKAKIQVQDKGVITNFGGDPKYHYANLRFQLKPGYEDPFYIWEDRMSKEVLEVSRVKVSDNPETYENQIIAWDKITADNLDSGKLKSGYIYGPCQDDEGREWYYIRISNPPSKSGHKMCLLTLTAPAMKYMVRYMVGTPKNDLTNGPADGSVTNMPEFSTDDSSWDDDLTGEGGLTGKYIERYDDNGGNFYDRLSYPTISISDKEPADDNGKKFFRYWVFVDCDEKIIPQRDEQGNEMYDENGDPVPIIVDPNGVLHLDDVFQYGVSLSSDIGGTDYNYYVIRLKGVWSDTPEDFKFYVRMVWTDKQTGESHVMDLVQNVTTSSTDPNLTEDGCLIVTVNTVTEVFKNWFRLHPFYAYDVRNFIATSARPKDQMKDNPIWEAYPEQFTAGSAESGLPNPDAYYRIEVGTDNVVHYVVQREGTIILYLTEVNGKLPITKSVTGVDPGEDAFEYTITAHLLQSDIDRSKSNGEDYLSPESLMNMLPFNTYMGFAPDATMSELKDFTGTDVELHFTRHAAIDNKGDPVGRMEEWYSEATFTLKGGEATVLGLPQGSYTITEAKGDTTFKYDVTVDGNASEDRKATREVEAGKDARTVNYGNTAQPVEYELKIGKEIVGRLSDTGVPEAAQNAEFGFKWELTAGDSTQVEPGASTTSITTQNGKGEGTFGLFTFHHTGTYTFLITETTFDEEKYFPNPRAHGVTVTVENQNGKLVVTKVIVDSDIYSDDKNAKGPVANAKATFINTYIGDIKEALVLPEVTKVLLGRNTLPAGMFTFELSAAEQEGMTLPENTTATNGNGADGSVVFDPIEFTAEGEYTVTVTEKNDGKDGIIYDGRTVTITYKVENVGGVLKVTQTTYQDGIDTFTNQAYADASFDVLKNYELSKRPGGQWEGDTFTVSAKLTGAAGEVKYNDVSLSLGAEAELELTGSAPRGSFDFRFYNEGTYTFEVREINDSLPGVSYDSSIYYVTVTVTANGEAMNSAVSVTKNGRVVRDGTVTFDNKFDPDKIDVVVNANKVLQDAYGRSVALNAGRFRFALRQAGTQTGGFTAANDANGNVTFTLKEMGLGTYTYTLSEIDSGETGVVYDKTEYTVTIKVEVKPGSAAASYTVVYAKGNETVNIPTFTNVINSIGQLVVSKEVAGEGGDQQKAFRFRVELSDTNMNGQHGDMSFVNGVAEFDLKHNESKTATGLITGTAYTVTEADSEEYVSQSYGEAGTIRANVPVTARFVNVKTEEELPDVPKTGDDSHIGLWAALMILSASVLCVVGKKAKREATKRA